MSVRNHQNYEAAIAKATDILRRISGKNSAILAAEGKTYAKAGAGYTHSAQMNKIYVGTIELFDRIIEEIFLDKVAEIILSGKSPEDKQTEMRKLNEDSFRFLHDETANRPYLCIREDLLQPYSLLKISEALKTSKTVGTYCGADNLRTRVLTTFDTQVMPKLKEYGEQHGFSDTQVEALALRYLFDHSNCKYLGAEMLRGNEITPSMDALLEARYNEYDELTAQGWVKVSSFKTQFTTGAKHITGIAQNVRADAVKAGYEAEDIVKLVACRNTQNDAPSLMISPLGLSGSESFKGFLERAKTSKAYKVMTRESTCEEPASGRS